MRRRSNLKNAKEVDRGSSRCYGSLVSHNLNLNLLLNALLLTGAAVGF